MIKILLKMLNEVILTFLNKYVPLTQIACKFKMLKMIKTPGSQWLNRKSEIFSLICVMGINIELNSWVCLWARLLADITDALKHKNSMQTNLYWTRNSYETARVSAGMNGDWSVCIDFISCTIHRNQNQFRSAAAEKPRLTGTYLDTPL